MKYTETSKDAFPFDTKTLRRLKVCDNLLLFSSVQMRSGDETETHSQFKPFIKLVKYRPKSSFFPKGKKPSTIGCLEQKVSESCQNFELFNMCYRYVALP